MNFAYISVEHKWLNSSNVAPANFHLCEIAVYIVYNVNSRISRLCKTAYQKTHHFLQYFQHNTGRKRPRNACAAPARFFLTNVVINVRLSVDMTEEKLGLTEHPWPEKKQARRESEREQIVLIKVKDIPYNSSIERHSSWVMLILPTLSTLLLAVEGREPCANRDIVLCLCGQSARSPHQANWNIWIPSGCLEMLMEWTLA